MLATIDDLEAYLGLTSGNTDEALLGGLLERASGIVDQLCNRRLELATYSETRSGTGGSYLALRQAPIVAISSLVLSGVALTASDFTFDDYGIYLTRGFFPRGAQTIAVTYEAGYAVVPAELQHAAIRIAALLYRGKDRLGETSRSIGGGTTAFAGDDIPADVRDILVNYKRVVPV